MKRFILLLVCICSLFFITSCDACGKKYEITENAILLEYGKTDEYVSVFKEGDDEDVYYCILKGDVVIGLENISKKGKFSVGYIYYDEGGSIVKVVPKKTYILDKDQTMHRNFTYSNNAGSDNYDGYFEYDYWKEVIILYESNNLYIDTSHFE